MAFLTSVSRTALCCEAMFPRPEYTCGNSVMLWSPSCSASLSERLTPLQKVQSVTCKITYVHPKQKYEGWCILKYHCSINFNTFHHMHQILWMISSLWKTNFMRSSLMSSSLLMLGNFSCMSFFTPRLMPTGTTFKLLQEDMERVSGYCKKPPKIAFVWRCISAFTLKTIIGKSCLEAASCAPLN